MSGTLRTTLDVFDEYEDNEVFEALRRVHLLPSVEDPVEETTENVNAFRDLDAPVSEGGDNFSAGEKQLLWWELIQSILWSTDLNNTLYSMARAILKRSKVLVMDEATASVDYGEQPPLFMNHTHPTRII